ncbi:MAG: GNAT family N-acetyltransferase [Spirochaetaceae bacterium]|nr:GNAT family N-acetyltransferase [Spirochaetaceae bacterium]
MTTQATVPFLDWEWFAALEESGSACPATGWQPLHLTLWDNDRLAAAAPFYLRTSSRGEYVYDYFWAEAAASVSRPWYPKLVGMVPATPAEGYRFLCAPDMDEEAVTRIMLSAAEEICRKNGVAGLHILFADPAWSENLEGCGYTAWEHSHFLWENEGYAAFDDYLARFNKNQRRNIRREYRGPGEQGVRISIVPGEQATQEHFRKMFELFSLTNDKFIPWDARFVNEDFFLRLEKDFRKNLAFAEARRTPRPGGGNGEELLALAFLVRKGERLWGRYWGAYEEVKDLHFAACYYAPIDWAIREKIRFFDPGAGSTHKVRRGFRLVTDRSYHKFFDPLVEKLFRDNVETVNAYEHETIAEVNAQLPFAEKLDL